MKKKKIVTTALALLLPVCAGIGSAHAYFTDHVAAAGGGYAIEVGRPDTELEETFSKWTKHVTVKNTGEIPVYVRVKAFCGDEYYLEVTENDDWKAGDDGYYYYVGKSREDSGAGVLEVGRETPTDPGLNIKILLAKTDAYGDHLPVPDDPDEPGESREKFNVVVICERTPLQYGDDGGLLSPAEADWTEYRSTEWSEKEGGEGR